MLKRGLIVLLAFATLGFGIPETPGQRNLFDLVNSTRAARDRTVLVARKGMFHRSQVQAKAMAEAGEIYHSNLKLPPGAIWAGEIVGVGSNVYEVMEAFLASPEHKKILLHRATWVGVGFVRHDNCVWIVVQIAERG